MSDQRTDHARCGNGLGPKTVAFCRAKQFPTPTHHCSLSRSGKSPLTICPFSSIITALGKVSPKCVGEIRKASFSERLFTPTFVVHREECVFGSLRACLGQLRTVDIYTLIKGCLEPAVAHCRIYFVELFEWQVFFSLQSAFPFSPTGGNSPWHL